MKSVLIYIFLSFSTTTCVAEILKKVIVVARHGNRAPNAPVPYLCPNMKVTYWMGRMPEVLLSLARKPTIDDLSKSRFYWPLGLKMSVDADEEQPWEMTVEEYWDRLKIGVFLNHRELMMAIAKMLEIGGKVESDLPAGSMFVFEVYEEDGSSETSLKMKFWKPTQPSAEQKYRGGYVDGNLLDFYGNGSVTELTPKICENQSKCMWSDYRRALQQWTRRTGSWEEICHASAEPFGPAEDSLIDDDDDDMWMSPHERVLQRIIYGFDGRQETVGKAYSAAAVASSDTVLA
ncbi:hypothetical protein Pmar_PMAR024171 [Perkinsus marinus ATCC 50983]|uniref:Prostatic acid phosphatase n=1 Tax=Perkinsus marinus (strain ATCC 50983 / TXsc) TaxID=423536 RepID=C5L2D5_PERM5|nr:hypothetical protein Pmar_PMAR024171 [Perkinsus marinus ATCC 50983]EER09147.1 hypothetical protein Pmar_PMAR024171 [Perkinsus marinus ATCC 50983]|eukprot:XP_002777331.1 hypothetical protein Pmar_PMAR024171 [Perkinsus marinus ATCC 50983]